MDSHEPDLTAAVKALAAEARRQITDHPDGAELVRYQQGTLEAGPAERLGEHLALCPECTRALLLLESFPLAPSAAVAAASLSPAETARLRRRVKRQVRQDSREPGWRVLAAVAAGLFVAVVGLTAWGLSQRAALERLAVPRSHVVLADLVSSAEQYLRARTSENRLELPEETDSVVLVLALADARSLPAYAVRLTDDRGEVRWEEPSLPRGPDGSFALDVPAGFLTPGRYQIELRPPGADGGGAAAIYPLLVVRPGSAAAD